MTNSAPNSFLNSAQRKIIIDWFVEMEEETSLIDETMTVEEIADYRKKLEAMTNPALHEEMKGFYCPELWRQVSNAR